MDLSNSKDAKPDAGTNNIAALLQFMQKIGWFNRAEIESQVYTIIHSKCAEYIQAQQFIANGPFAFGEITPSDVAEIEAQINSLIQDELNKLSPQRKRAMLQLYTGMSTSQEVSQRNDTKQENSW